MSEANKIDLQINIIGHWPKKDVGNAQPGGRGGMTGGEGKRRARMMVVDRIHACVAGMERKMAPRRGHMRTIRSPFSLPVRAVWIASAIRAVQRIAAASEGKSEGTGVPGTEVMPRRSDFFAGLVSSFSSIVA
jgi:hypothetical protein